MTQTVVDLIKKELNLKKGSIAAGIQRVGDLTKDQVKKIAKVKFGSDDEPFINQVIGTCRSMGITIEQGAITEEEKKKYQAALKEKEAAKVGATAPVEETEEKSIDKKSEEKSTENSKKK